MSNPTDEDLNRFGWAPGNYEWDCRRCKGHLTGAWRAFHCRDCAVEMFATAPPPPPAPQVAENPKTGAGRLKPEPHLGQPRRDDVDPGRPGERGDQVRAV